MQDDPSIIYFEDGDFAGAVLDRWSTTRPGIRTPIGDASAPWSWPHCEAVVLATSTPQDALALRLDEICSATKTRWMSLSMDETRVFVGPTVGRGTGATYDCFLRRGRQHRRFSEDRTLPTGIDLGFAPHDVALTAAVAEQALSGLLDGDADRTGVVVEIDLVTGMLQRSRVTPVNNSPRRRHRPGGTEADDLGTALSAVLPARSLSGAR